MKIVNGYVFGEKDFVRKDVYIKDGYISNEYDTLDYIDAKDMYVVPGFIEGHTHGRSGIDIMKASKNELSKLSKEYLNLGVTTVFPTVMTASISDLEKAIDNIKETDTSGGADFLGIHVEGPYISKKKPGCHDVNLIRKPVLSELLSLTERISPLKARFTIAPEECDDGVIKELSKHASISIGHTNCSLYDAYKALDDGANGFTHTFNAMSAFTHRNPGCANAALASEAYCEFICDGLHLDYEVVEASYRAKTKYENKFVIITDSIPSAGLCDGDYDMNGIKFHLDKNGARTKEGTIVGSTVSIIQSIRNVTKNCSFTLYDAIESSTKNTADMLGLKDRGTLDTDMKADVLILSKDLEIVHIIKDGTIIY